MLDLVNGSDAQDGTTWAKAWKTFLNGPTAGRIAAGDTIRVAKTDAPISYAQNAQWTNKSKTVTLTTGLTYNIDVCDVAWTGKLYITQAQETFYAKENGISQKFTCAASFLTGLMAFKATGTIVLNTYDKVSFWIHVDTATPANMFKLSLCSDVAGVTSVHDTTIDFAMEAYTWYPIQSATGALPASVKSVALYAIADPGTRVIRLDNILACTTLTLRTMIGKNAAADTFYPIQSINGTTIKIGNPQDNGTSGLVYPYATQNATLYYRPTFMFPIPASSTTVMNAPNKSGAAGSLITFYGGYNIVSGARDGETVLDAICGRGYIMGMDTFDYISFYYMSFVRGSRGISANDNSERNNVVYGGCSFNSDAGIKVAATAPAANTSDYWIVTAGDYIGNGQYGISVDMGRYWDIETNNLAATPYMLSLDEAHFAIVKTNTTSYGTNYGIYCTYSSDVVIEDCIADGNTMRGMYFSTCANLNAKNLSADLNGYDGILISGCPSAILDGVDVRTNSQYGLAISSSMNVKVIAFVSTGNVAYAMNITDSQIYINGTTIAEANKIQNWASYPLSRDIFISVKKYEGGAADHRVFLYAGTILSEAATRHTASGLAWNMDPSQALFKLRLLPNNFKAAVIANKEVTIQAYVRKNAAYNGNAARLVLSGKVLTGIATDQIDTHAAAVDDWELLEVKGTPTEAGVVEFYVDCDGTAGNIFVDDFAITQAA